MRKAIIILVLSGVVVSILICIFLWHETINLIQSLLIVVLVAITVYYAMQAQKLVEQEEKSLQELKRKRIAEHWEKRLDEFYRPLTDVNYFLTPTTIKNAVFIPYMVFNY